MVTLPYKVGDTLTLTGDDGDGWICDGDHKVIRISDDSLPVVGTRTAINPDRIAAINGVPYSHS